MSQTGSRLAAFVSASIFVLPLLASQTAAAAEAFDRQLPMAMGPGPSVRGVALILNHAYRHGIELRAEPRSASAGGEAADGALQDLYLRYAKIVSHGQITPEQAGMIWDIPRPAFDPRAARAAFEGRLLGEALASLPPPHRGYAALVRALAVYRAIAAKGGWPSVPEGKLLSQGMTDPRVVALRRRLAAEGTERINSLRNEAFDADLHAALLKFQRRHGLKPDGIVGSKTLAALNIPVERRVSQIIANMERWRWLPRALPARRGEVNIAAARLRVLEGSRQVLTMRTVVGSPRHPTPVLTSEITQVVLNPPWNVPDSIWRREIFPKLRRDPGYLAAKHMVILDRPNDPRGRKIDWPAHRSPPPGIRIRQVPGPFNALGAVKFHVPNRFDVYLHDTSQRALFKNADRALSHGCIRLQRPDMLLAYLFSGEESKPKLSQADTPQPWVTRTMPVSRPLPVYLLYRTAFAGPDGSMRFRKDIYGHDDRLIAALTQPGQAITASLLASGCGWKPHAT